MTVAPERRQKTVSEAVNVAVDASGWLDDGELLTGVPTVAEVNTSDLTITNVGVSTAALVINGRTVPAGKAVQFHVSGGVANRMYTIAITATTDATPQQTRRGLVRLAVVED